MTSATSLMELFVTIVNDFLLQTKIEFNLSPKVYFKNIFIFWVKKNKGLVSQLTFK